MIKIILAGLVMLIIVSTLFRCSTGNNYSTPSGGRSTYTNFQGGGPSRGK
ncbi:MAG: hypothetical protein AAF757_13645 [Cyanobacteria bacterium P01_D01_bin.116]